jgi:hypothetical protein
MDLNGKFFGIRIKTIYNTNTKQTQIYQNDIEYVITKISDVQYLVVQTNLNSGNSIELMFFKNNTGYLSSSANGIDNIYLTCCNNFIHNWSIPVDSEGNLTNAHTKLDRII